MRTNPNFRRKNFTPIKIKEAEKMRCPKCGQGHLNYMLNCESTISNGSIVDSVVIGEVTRTSCEIAEISCPDCGHIISDEDEYTEYQRCPICNKPITNKIAIKYRGHLIHMNCYRRNGYSDGTEIRL